MIILELKNITKSFDGIRAVEQVSLGFDKGKITALLGPNGAGKTTIFNLISGFLHPDKGTITYCDKDITFSPPWYIAQKGIGRLFQDVRIFERLTVKDNMLAAFKDQRGESAFFSLFARRQVNREEAALSARALQLLEFVGLADKASARAEELSFGEQKLLAIARLLAADAELLLFDEPTAGVSPQMLVPLLKLIRKLPAQGKTIVIIEHNMNVVTEISDWIYFIDEGQVASFGLPGEVLCDPEVRRAYIGL